VKLPVLFRGRDKAKPEDRAVSDLIAEQRERESVRVWRRGWCISEAVIVIEEMEVSLRC
jgi:hypothetical protein